MKSYRTSKFHSERPGSSAKTYEYENSDYEFVEGSKIPKVPKRTYSLEGKRSSCSSRKSNTRQKISTTSMIPRLEWKKQCNKTSTLNNVIPNNVNIRTKIQDERQTNSEKLEQLRTENADENSLTTISNSQCCSSPKTVSSLECQVNKEFVNFKNNVLKIPEYWTDAGQTATNILKNAISIVTKQYPTVDKESFEVEIQSILKATEAVKQQILTKTENIINKATQIYTDRSETAVDNNEEDLRKITKKMEELRNEVNIRKNVFGDLLKCGSEMKQLMELEKTLKQKGTLKDGQWKDIEAEALTNDNEAEGPKKISEGKKCKTGVEANTVGSKKKEKSTLHSCGDVPREDIKSTSEILDESCEEEVHLPKREKTTQTIHTWVSELLKKEKNLTELNQQVAELQQLCKDHISKFKSFNLQIKLRGICNKAQHMSVTKELQILNDEKMQLEEKNGQLQCYNKDLESAIKQKDLDLHQKDKLINQQKKLLHVRDELIEMLKSRCNLEETQRY